MYTVFVGGIQWYLYDYNLDENAAKIQLLY